MKKTLLILCACLFGVLSGAKAWTSVVPYDGKSYYLYNIGTDTYWFGTNSTYTTKANIADATPITMESGHKLAYNDGNTTYRIYQDRGTGSPSNTSGVNFTLRGDANGYSLVSKNSTQWLNDDYDRDMQAGGSFPRVSKNESNVTWQFISVYEVDPNTPNVCADAAESAYVTAANGWERVTDISTLEASLSNYFFAIVCANAPGLMVNLANGDVNQQAGGSYAGSKSMWYSNSTNPETDNSFLWIIDKNNTENYEGYTFRNVSSASKTIQTEYDWTNNKGLPWYAHTNDQANPCQWNSYQLIPSNGVFSIKALANGGDNYLGLWTPSNDYVNGQELAGNKGDGEKGTFLIYRKAKKNIDMTGLIKNPSFEIGNLDGWTSGNFERQSGNSNYSGNFAQMWTGSGNLSAGDLNQTISLPAGTYRLTVKSWADIPCNLYASINGVKQEISYQSKEAVDRELTFTVPTTGDVVIGIYHNGKNNVSESTWVSCDDFRLTYLGEMATADDYTALENAISNAESKTIGFDDGEYAPYNNIAAINSLAAAKAINRDADNIKVDVHNAISAIADDKWTANSGEVNAIPGNKTFAEGSYTHSGNYDLANGWSTGGDPYGYNTRIQGINEGADNTGLQDNEGNVVRHALLVKFGTSYGETGGYTLPLKANTVYKFSFEYALWNEGGEITKGLTVTSPNGATIEMSPSTVSKNEGDKEKCGHKVNTAWYVYSATFKTIEAGDYVLNIVNTDAGNQRQMAFSALELKRYNGMIEDDDTNTQVYYGTFKSRVDLTPTDEHPFVDITRASFDGDVFVNLDDNPNGLVYATPSQVSSIKSSYGSTTKAIPNVVSNDGNVCESLVIYDGHPFFVPSHSNIRATEATYSRGDVSNTFGTICLPFDVSSDENIQYYTTDQIVGNVLKLTEVTTVLPAGTPAIFKKKDGGATEITAAASDVAITNNAGKAGTSVKLVGTFTKIVVGDVHGTDDTAANNYYYIKNNQFWQGKNYFNIPAFRAYLDAEGSSHARLSLQIDDETTAINELKTLDEKQGLKDGKYLIGGKIIVVKDGKQFNVNGVLK